MIAHFAHAQSGRGACSSTGTSTAHAPRLRGPESSAEKNGAGLVSIELHARYVCKVLGSI